MTSYAVPRPPQQALDLAAALDRIELALRTPDPGALAGYEVQLHDGRRVPLSAVSWAELHADVAARERVLLGEVAR